MSREVRVKRVTVPVGGTAANPQTFDLSFPARVVRELEIAVPAGPRGELHIALGAAGTIVIPVEAGTYLAPENEVIRWPLEGYWDSGSWTLFAYNTGSFSHGVEFRFLVDLVAGATPSPGPISADQLVPVVTGAPPPAPIEAPPPAPVESPPPPPAPVEAPPPAPIEAPPPAPVKAPPPSASPPPAPPMVAPPSPPPSSVASSGPMGVPVPDRMYDSTVAGDVPQGARMIGWYGNWPTSTPTPPRPGVFYVKIVGPGAPDDGDVLDVEGGAATSDQVQGWVQARRSHGIDPVVYATRGTIDALKLDFDNAQVRQPHWWVAAWDNNPQVPGDCVAKQYANPQLTGGHFDLSAVTLNWPGLQAWAAAQPVNPSPTPSPAPAPAPPPPPNPYPGISGVPMTAAEQDDARRAAIRMAYWLVGREPTVDEQNSWLNAAHANGWGIDLTAAGVYDRLKANGAIKVNG